MTTVNEFAPSPISMEDRAGRRLIGGGDMIRFRKALLAIAATLAAASFTPAYAITQ